jgi:WXG100 family type VII secretion target
MTISLQDDAFDHGRGDVREAAHRLRHARDRADHRVTGFLEAGWQGLAADAFTVAWDDWRAAATDVEQGLLAMAELMDATQRDLHAHDDASRASLDAVAARIVDRLGR